MGRIGIILSLFLVVACDSARIATEKTEMVLPTYVLTQGEGTRYIYFNESGATATTDPGTIHAVTAHGVMIYNSEDTPVLPDGLEWGVNFYKDEVARIEPRDAVVIRAYAGAASDWLAAMVRSRAAVQAEQNPKSVAALEDEASLEQFREQIKRLPGQRELNIGDLNRLRMQRWAISSAPKLVDYGLTENPGLTVVYVTSDCTTCDAWIKRSEEDPYIHVYELERKDIKFQNLMKFLGQPTTFPAVFRSGQMAFGPP